jgi:hypothetical protein
LARREHRFFLAVGAATKVASSSFEDFPPPKTGPHPITHNKRSTMPYSASKLQTLHASRQRKENALARLRELEVEEREGELVSVETVSGYFKKFAQAFRGIVQNSKLSEQEKYDLQLLVAKTTAELLESGTKEQAAKRKARENSKG